MPQRQPGLIGRRYGRPVRAVVLLLPGGYIRSGRRPNPLVDLGLFLVERALRRWAPLGLARYLLRYRNGGWFAGPEAAATAADARWAVEEIARRHPGRPLALIGHSLGGRAAIAAAGHPAVRTVAAISPWLPPDEDVRPVAGRRLLVVHGSADRSDSSALQSLAFCERARAAGVACARFIVPGDGHLLLRRPFDWAEVVASFVSAATGFAPSSPLVVSAFDATESLSVPLPAASLLRASRSVRANHSR